jgi:hypothetical protein
MTRTFYAYCANCDLYGGCIAYDGTPNPPVQPCPKCGGDVPWSEEPPPVPNEFGGKL